MKVQIINGPNLNLLGIREPEHYGQEALAQIQELTDSKKPAECELHWFQSNIEGEIIEKIHQNISDKFDAIIINAGGYSHTSVAIHDALKLFQGQKVEVHLSQLYKREEFRQKMITAKACDIVLTGLGKLSYSIAVQTIYLVKEEYVSDNRF